jgi:hypothetical protein
MNQILVRIDPDSVIIEQGWRMIALHMREEFSDEEVSRVHVFVLDFIESSDGDSLQAGMVAAAVDEFIGLMRPEDEEELSEIQQLNNKLEKLFTEKEGG